MFLGGLLPITIFFVCYHVQRFTPTTSLQRRSSLQSHLLSAFLCLANCFSCSLSVLYFVSCLVHSRLPVFVFAAPLTARYAERSRRPCSRVRWFRHEAYALG